jgi:hypothetical protein
VKGQVDRQACASGDRTVGVELEGNVRVVHRRIKRYEIVVIVRSYLQPVAGDLHASAVSEIYSRREIECLARCSGGKLVHYLRLDLARTACGYGSGIATGRIAEVRSEIC